jgi:hypothetical protein
LVTQNRGLEENRIILHGEQFSGVLKRKVWIEGQSSLIHVECAGFQVRLSKRRSLIEVIRCETESVETIQQETFVVLQTKTSIEGRSHVSQSLQDFMPQFIPFLRVHARADGCENDVIVTSASVSPWVPSLSGENLGNFKHFYEN